MTILYDPQALQLTFLFRWKGTIFPLVLSDPMFWFLLIVHVALLLWDGKLLRQDGEGLPPLDWQASTVAMGLLTFFLVFCMLAIIDSQTPTQTSRILARSPRSLITPIEPCCRRQSLLQSLL